MHIPEDGFDGCSYSLLSYSLLDLLGSIALNSCCTMCLFCGHSLLHVALDQGFKVSEDLFVQLFLHLFAPKQRLMKRLEASSPQHGVMIPLPELGSLL